jgi:hypothetical protein
MVFIGAIVTMSGLLCYRASPLLEPSPCYAVIKGKFILIIKTALLCWQKSFCGYIRVISSVSRSCLPASICANARSTGDETTLCPPKLKLNYSPDNVCRDYLCRAVIERNFN